MKKPITKLPTYPITNSPDLRRELGLTDLALTQILFIVGLPWVGVAAKQGPAHVIFWIIAMVLFLAEDRGAVGFSDDAAVCRAVCAAHHSGREPSGVLAEDHYADWRDERGGVCDLPIASVIRGSPPPGSAHAAGGRLPWRACRRVGHTREIHRVVGAAGAFP